MGLERFSQWWARVGDSWGRRRRYRKRETDLRVLWPRLVERSGTIELARSAFLRHCLQDEAWVADKTADEIQRQVLQLGMALDSFEDRGD